MKPFLVATALAFTVGACGSGPLNTKACANHVNDPTPFCGDGMRCQIEGELSRCVSDDGGVQAADGLGAQADGPARMEDGMRASDGALKNMSDDGGVQAADGLGAQADGPARMEDGTRASDSALENMSDAAGVDTPKSDAQPAKSDAGLADLADNTPPSIVTVTPMNGALGVLATAKIVVRFSEPMNRAATEAAWNSVELPKTAVQFSWSADGSEMTVVPRTLLEYIEGTRADLPAKTYTFSVSTAASDVAGNPLASTNQVTFTTLRRLTLTLKCTRSLTGNVRSDGKVNLEGGLAGGETTFILAGDSAAIQGAYLKGFLTFDLAGLPATTTSIEHAVIRLYQKADASPSAYAELGNLNVDHAAFAELSLASFNAAPIPPGTLGIISSKSLEGWVVLAVADAIRDDHQNRAARSARSQFRLFFDRTSNNDTSVDDTYFADIGQPNEPELQVQCLVP